MRYSPVRSIKVSRTVMQLALVCVMLAALLASPIGIAAQEPGPSGLVEIDMFDFTIGQMDLILPDGTTETVEMTGPATVAVYFEGATEGTATDNDGDGFDEVLTEMLELFS